MKKKKNIFHLTKTIAANQEKKEDDTSLILCKAVNSDESLEEKKDWAQEVTYMVRREGERKSESSELVLVSIYGLFIYAPRSGFLPPTSAEDSHWMREMYLTGGSASAFYVMRWAMLTYLHRPH